MQVCILFHNAKFLRHASSICFCAAKRVSRIWKFSEFCYWNFSCTSGGKFVSHFVRCRHLKIFFLDTHFRTVVGFWKCDFMGLLKCMRLEQFNGEPLEWISNSKKIMTKVCQFGWRKFHYNIDLKLYNIYKSVYKYIFLYYIILILNLIVYIYVLHIFQLFILKNFFHT